MAHPNKRRKKKLKAKQKKEGPRPSPPTIEDPRNLLRIGGTIGEIRMEPQEREGRLWRAIRLRCEDRPKAVTHAWVNVYDSFGDYLAERVAEGRPICLGGYIRSLPEPHPITHQMWELYANQPICLDRTNPDGGYFACNEIMARGLLTDCESRIVGRRRNRACEFVLRCEGPGHESNLIEMIAFYNPGADITNIIEKWRRARELALAARVSSYGEGYTRTGIMATAVLLDLDEQAHR
jgi:hypothetical protein